MGLFVLVVPSPKRTGAHFLAERDGSLCSVNPQAGWSSVGYCGFGMLVQICLSCEMGKPLIMLPERNK